MKVAVLMGGPSEEHGVSLKSGWGIVEALTRRGWSTEPVVIPKLPSIPAACEFVAHALQGSGAGVAFIALHGTFGEDGTIQHVCEDLRVPYTGSDAASSRLGMDKAASRRRFEEAGLLVPRWQVIDLTERGPWNSQMPGMDRMKGFSCPLVVKPTNQGSSLGVSIVGSEGNLPAAIAAAGRYGSRILVEEFIPGRELTVGILGDEPLPVVEIRPSRPFFDFTAKYTAGATEYLVPAPLPSATAHRVQAAGLAAHRALGCRHLSRVDLILREDHEPVLLEVNTIPGFTPTSLLPKAAGCANVSYDELCEQLVMMAWQGSAHLV